MKNQPIFSVLLAFALGIILEVKSPEFECNTLCRAFFSGFFLLLFVVFNFRKKIQINSRQILSFLILCLFVLWGYVRHFYANKPSFEASSGDLLKVKVEKILSADFYRQNKAFVRVLNPKQSNFESSATRALVYFDQKVNTGEIFLLKAKVLEFPKNKNPYGFDYGKYLKDQGIHFVLESKASKKLKGQIGIRGKIYQWFERAQNQSSYTGESIDWIKTMFLGDSMDFSAQQTEALRTLGLSHVVVVSGLHIGILYGFFWGIFSRIFNLKKNKVEVLSFLMVLLYVLLLEPTASVLRAVLFLALYILSRILKRPQPFEHVLYLTALLCLIWNPKFLFQLSFQLSFAAVFFIGWLNPLWYNVFAKFKYKDSLWFGAMATSFNANLGVSGIILYYFGNFQIYSVLVNTLLTPIFSVLTVVYFLSGSLLLMGIDLSFVVNPLSGFLENALTFLENALKHGFSTGMYFSLFEVFLYYAFLLALGLGLKKNLKIPVLSLLILLFVYQLNGIIQGQKSEKKHEVWVFYSPRGLLLTQRNQNKATVYFTDEVEIEKIKTQFLDKWIKREKVNRVRFTMLPKLDHYQFGALDIKKDTSCKWQISSAQQKYIWCLKEKGAYHLKITP
ncbi:MAG: hypothetical protein C4K58_00945 [Flavobacteriaceae bacterium]|nr:MAG: hypothetical protein C4K58_00945 [Flavobacteriaceae bacterium]